MKQLIKNYGFNKSAGTVTFTDFGTVALDRLLLVTNVTRNTIVYQFNDPSLGGTVAGNVLSLAYNTSAMGNGDKLQIIYDCAAGDPLYDTASSQQAQGNVASGVADSGNPVKIGAVFNSSPPTFASGQRGDMQIDASGRLLVSTAPLADNVDSVAIRGKSLEVPFTTTTPQAVGTTDAQEYRSVSVQIVSQGTSSAITFQVSNDNTNWTSCFLGNVATNGILTSSTTSVSIYAGQLKGRFFRLSVASISAGTTAGVIQFFAEPTGQEVLSGVGATGGAVPTNAFMLGISDGTNIQALRGNIDTTALITASGATTTQTGPDQTNFNGVGVKVVLDVTSAGTGSITLQIDGKDAASGKYYPLLMGAAVTTNSTTAYTVFPGAAAVANSVANDHLPKVWRIKVTANNANPTTYTVGASVLV